MEELAYQCAVVCGQEDTKASAEAFEKLLRALSAGTIPGPGYLKTIEAAFGKGFVKCEMEYQPRPRLTPALGLAIKMATLQD